MCITDERAQWFRMVHRFQTRTPKMNEMRMRLDNLRPWVGFKWVLLLGSSRWRRSTSQTHPSEQAKRVTPGTGNVNGLLITIHSKKNKTDTFSFSVWACFSGSILVAKHPTCCQPSWIREFSFFFLVFFLQSFFFLEDNMEGVALNTGRTRAHLFPLPASSPTTWPRRFYAPR